MDVRSEDLASIFNGLSPTERAKFCDSTLLITGCAGFLGYYFMEFFRLFGGELGVKRVIALDNFILGEPSWIQPYKADSRFSLVDFDITSDLLEEVEGVCEVDYVIHMASIASPVFYRAHPIETLDANVWGLRRLLDFYIERQDTHSLCGFLFFSSSEIYGDPTPESIPTSEDYRGNVSCTGPRACYDEAKRFGETMCMLFSRIYGVPIGVARPFNNYGPGMRLDDKRVPADFAKAVMTGDDIVIYSNGAPTRTFCYVSDAITGYLKILLHGAYDYFNIGIAGPEISISELADIYLKAGKDVCSYGGKIRYEISDEADYLTNNPIRRCPSVEKAKRLLDYRPRIDVHEGVCRFLAFLQEEKAGGMSW